MDLSNVEHALETACRITSDSPGSPAADSARNNLVHLISNAIKSLRGDDNESAAASAEERHAQLHFLLQFLEEQFSSPLPAADEVLELAVTDLLPEILSCESESGQLCQSVRRLLSKMASICHPRDTITAFLGQMHSGFVSLARCSIFFKYLPSCGSQSAVLGHVPSVVHFSRP